MLSYPLGSHFTTSLCGVHPCPCATSPHRHVDHKSCQDDAPKLLQPSSYAHIITTPPTTSHISLRSPFSHSIVGVTSDWKTGWHWPTSALNPQTNATDNHGNTAGISPVPKGNGALKLGVRRGAEERENVKGGMGCCVQFRFRKRRSFKSGGEVRLG